jgi:hypothetical protein
LTASSDAARPQACEKAAARWENAQAVTVISVTMTDWGNTLEYRHDHTQAEGNTTSGRVDHQFK